MGLENEGTNEIYLTIHQGLITKRVAKGTPDAKLRILKNSKEVYEVGKNTLSGYLENIILDDPPVDHQEYGKSWIFTIVDGDDVFKLRIGAKGREAHAFLARLPNVDFSQPIKVLTYWIEGDDDVFRNFLAIHQGAAKILPYFTKEEPNGLPDLEVKVVDDIKYYDGVKRREFLLRMVNEKVLPKIKEQRPLSEATIEPAVVDDTDVPDEPPMPTEDDEPVGDALDSLPF